MTNLQHFGRRSPFLVWAICFAGIARAGGLEPPGPGSPRALAASGYAAHAPAANPAELAARLKALFKQWKAIPTAQVAEKVTVVKNRIDETVTTYVVTRLDERPRPLPLSVEDDLNEALTTAIWESVFGLSPAAVTAAIKSNPPQHTAFVIQGTGSASNLYAAGFRIGYGNTFSTRVHAFAPEAGMYHAVGLEGGQLDGAISGAVRLRSFGPHELRFLIWCLHVGSPEALTTVALCKFDGKQLRALWLRQNVPAAKLSFPDHQVVIQSNEVARPHNSKGRVWRYRRETYRQVVGGLELVKTDRWTEGD